MSKHPKITVSRVHSFQTSISYKTSQYYKEKQVNYEKKIAARRRKKFLIDLRNKIFDFFC